MELEYFFILKGFHKGRLGPRSVTYCIGIPILGSRPILSIPNPGIGDALIPGFRIMKHEHVSHILYVLLCYYSV